ncbi:MAG: hypothetical protein ACTSU2_02435 [Promethearchaeota archaeon]
MRLFISLYEVGLAISDNRLFINTQEVRLQKVDISADRSYNHFRVITQKWVGTTG